MVHAGGLNAIRLLYCTLQEDIWSLAFGLSVLKSDLSDVNVQEVPPKLSSAYMITVRPLGIRTDEAQSFGTPMAASCDKV
jgi:hypothetical protein